MPDAIALAAPPAPVVTRDQLDLIKQTVAIGATDAELKLYLYDCARRGVHPLDGLVHFTKRGGRYRPVVGIDYLRGRAHDTGEVAGIDDVIFDKEAHTATVTVYRLTRGTRYAYTATARYGEYVPEAGPNGRGDVMWRRMPHVMLGKCAEALALRKAFPQQLGGLYVKEELDQARPDFEAEATSIADQYALPPVSTLPPEAGSDDARDHVEVHHFTSERLAALAPGVVLVTQFHSQKTANPNVTRYTITVAGGPSWPLDQTRVTTIKETFASRVEAAWHAEQAIAITVTKGRFGFELASVTEARERAADPLSPPDALPDRGEDPIPF
jgi:phage recombination protein Bet